MIAAEIIDAMIAAGASAEVVAAAWKADLAKDEAKREEKRAKDASRQRRHRESRNVTVTECDDALPPVPSPEVPPQTPLPTPTHTPVRGTTRAREAASRLPEQWKPARLARDTVSGQIVENRGQEWARRALESFKNHWRSANGPNARKRDWQAAFANWIIEQDNRDGRSNTLGRHQPADGLSATARAALSVFGPDPGDGQGISQ